MDNNLQFTTEKRIERTIKALEKNNVSAVYVRTAADVIPAVKELAPQGCIVSCGGSMSLAETGVMELLRSGYYKFLDRARPGITAEEIDRLYRDTFFADVYFSSANAITENGEIYNVDGNSNRIAALAFGPRKVVMVVGINKIVKDLEAAKVRVQEFAAPANAKRLNCKTPCALTGICENCSSPARICCNTLIMGQQRKADRVHVIFVGDSVGY